MNNVSFNFKNFLFFFFVNWSLHKIHWQPAYKMMTNEKKIERIFLEKRIIKMFDKCGGLNKKIFRFTVIIILINLILI